MGEIPKMSEDRRKLSVVAGRKCLSRKTEHVFVAAPTVPYGLEILEDESSFPERQNHTFRLRNFERKPSDPVDPVMPRGHSPIMTFCFPIFKW